MKKRLIQYKLLVLVLLFSASAMAQLQGYQFEQELMGVEDTWHELEIPATLYQDCRSDLKDLRVVGYTQAGDTVEAPYIRESLKPYSEVRDTPHELINQTSTTDGHYFTFVVDSTVTMSQIDLNFSDRNFDWKVTLEGSWDQQEWFTILDDYRILSLINGNTNIHYTRLNFSPTQYRYYRVFIPNETQPQLRTASVKFKKDHAGAFHHLPASVKKTPSEKDKSSAWLVNFDQRYRVDRLQIDADYAFDFYRNFKIEYLADSNFYKDEWHYVYRELSRDVITSKDENDFLFAPKVTKQLRITVQDDDNEPIDIRSVRAMCVKQKLKVRFSKPDSRYALYFGNPKANRPRYDLSYFQDQIPEEMSPVKLGAIVKRPEVQPLEEPQTTKVWLWVVMGVAIGLLGLFTFRMIR